MASRVLGAFVVAATATIASLALATPASAHNKTLTPGCTEKDGSFLSVSLTSYASGGKYDEKPNKITITVDGEKSDVDDTAFGKNYSTKLKRDGSVPHTYVVTVTAADGKKYGFEETRTTEACLTAKPPKPTEPTTATKPPAEVPSSSATVPPSETPVPPAGAQPEPPLAATGASPMWLLLSGLGLVGAGAAAIIVVRRRRA